MITEKGIRVNKGAKQECNKCKSNNPKKCKTLENFMKHSVKIFIWKIAHLFNEAAVDYNQKINGHQHSLYIHTRCKYKRWNVEICEKKDPRKT